MNLRTLVPPYASLDSFTPRLELRRHGCGAIANRPLVANQLQFGRQIRQRLLGFLDVAKPCRAQVCKPPPQQTSLAS